jgi:uncharacterized protein YbjT (DUF2867 family)
MKVVIFGATGMVGKGVLLECLDDPDVESVLCLVRGPTGITHEKLEEIEHEDFHDYSSVEDRLAGLDACFFCLGVSAAGMSEERYTRLTYDLTLAAARTLVRLNPQMVFTYVSGAGTDSSETGRSMWARVKGRTENALLGLGFRDAYMFRPGYIQPMRGIRSKTRLYQALYTVTSPFYPVWKALLPGYVTTTEKVGQAMIHVARSGYEGQFLENRDINELAQRARS